MAYRTLEVTLISAKDLSNVNMFTKMDVYAVAMIAGNPKSKKKTAPDRDGGKNPKWNATVKFTVPESDASSLVLNIVLMSERALGDREIGEVNVPVRELLDGWHRAAAVAATGGGGVKKSAAPSAQFVSYQVRSSRTSKGVLSISYKFSDVVVPPTPPPPTVYTVGPIQTAYDQPPSQPAYRPLESTIAASKGPEPVTAYPAPSSTSAAAYPPYTYPPPPQAGYAGYPPPPQQGGYAGYPPPPQQGGYAYSPASGGYGYPPPQQSVYGYPPAAGGYGYGAAGPQVVQPAGGKKNKMGLGLGAGLLGGAIGGMILGDMLSDDASAYDAGYDNGFCDGYDDGGFDDGGFGF